MRLIASTSFGPESRTYIYCQPLARFYYLASEVEDNYETSSSNELRRGEVHIEGSRFITGNVIRDIPEHVAWSEHRPQWSIQQNINQINMICEFYRFLLKNYSHPFWVYGHTLTSLVHWPSLRGLAESLACEGVFAGKPLVLTNHMFENRIRIPSVGTGPYMLGLSGAGILMSSDVLRKVLERSENCSHHVPSDVWLSSILHDIPKIPLARRDLSVNETDAERLSSIILSSNFVESEVKRGNFHFRVNSLARLTNPERRHLVDPKIQASLACKLLSIKETSALQRQAGFDEAAGFLQHFKRNSDSTYGSEFITPH